MLKDQSQTDSMALVEARMRGQNRTVKQL